MEPHVQQLLTAKLDHPNIHMKKDQKILKGQTWHQENTQEQTLNRMAAGRNLADFHLNGP